jgi:ferredoxin--NADP+ reductase
MAGLEGEPSPDSARVAIIGSGPAGFYLADYLLKNAEPRIRVDMFERLPVPFGLVRFGVAPDHQSIKRAQVAFQRTAAQPGFRFFGNVEVGSAVSVSELVEHYHAIAFAYGSATDRRLGIPGEDLPGSFAATSFVGWYNAHPDFVTEAFDLGSKRAVIVGMGNVALDVARILVRDPG